MTLGRDQTRQDQPHRYGHRLNFHAPPIGVGLLLAWQKKLSKRPLNTFPKGILLGLVNKRGQQYSREGGYLVTSLEKAIFSREHLFLAGGCQ
jgi:hypothetical protein